MSKKKANRILILDDEKDVTELLKYTIERKGYVCRVINNPFDFTRATREFSPDLILLDIMMPGLDGEQICRIAKADTTLRDIPIIFLTAKAEGEDIVSGLEMGAEDYIKKPFNVKELMLRISKVLVRKEGSTKATEENIQIGEVVLDQISHEVFLAGRKISLTATEFKLLYLLMKRKNRVQSRETLLTNVWGYDADLETRTVDTHILRVREKLAEHASLIQTIRGVGYKAIDV